MNNCSVICLVRPFKIIKLSFDFFFLFLMIQTFDYKDKYNNNIIKKNFIL